MCENRAVRPASWSRELTSTNNPDSPLKASIGIHWNMLENSLKSLTTDDKKLRASAIHIHLGDRIVYPRCNGPGFVEISPE